MTSQINVGLIGFGFSARTFHLPFLQALEPYNVRRIYTTQPSASLRDSSIQFTARLEDIWEDPEIDVVIITSPNALHFEHAFKALSHHKHVVVEKPFVLNEHEGRALIVILLPFDRQQEESYTRKKKYNSGGLIDENI